MAENKQKSTGVQRDDLDQFLARDRSEVVRNLLELSRSVAPLTMLFDSGQQSFPTSIIDLISDNTSVVIECSGDDALNKKVLAQQQVIVIGQPDGVKVRFVLEQMSTANYKGEKVFVAPIPREHYRMQRRQMFRINTLVREPVKVTLTLPDEEEVSLNVGNISSGGLRLDDVDHILEVEAMQMLTACSLQISDVEPFMIDLRVHNFYETTMRNGKSVQYVGCAIKNLRANDEREIQKYINRLQVAQRALT